MKITRCLTHDDVITYAALNDEGQAFALPEGPFGDRAADREPLDVKRFLAPIEPTQIVGIGLNYGHHADESGMPRPVHPVVFHKMLGSVAAHDDEIVLPALQPCEKTDYECELAVVIAEDCKDVRREDALSVVLGYTCANDVSARDWQLEKGGGQWSYGKSFDSFCPLGPVLVTRDEIADPNDLGLRTRLNGEVVQDWNTRDMIFDVGSLIAFLSAGTTLKAGTVILTGTPHGVGMAAQPPRWLRDGDVVEIEIDGIGTLRNRVVNG